MKNLFILFYSSFLCFLFFGNCLFSQSNVKKGLELNGKAYFDAGIYQYKNSKVRFAGDMVGDFTVKNADRKFFRFLTTFDVALNYGEKNIYNYIKDALPPFAQNTIFANEDASLNLNLKTMYISLFTEYVDINLGRQIITFGTGTFFSPINTFSQLNTSQLSSVSSSGVSFERYGVDSVDLLIPIGATGGIELTSTFSSKMDNIVSALKLYGNLFNVDLAIYGMYRTGLNQAVAGISFKGDLVVGIYGEAVGNIYTEKEKLKDSFMQLMLGIDYSFFSSKLLLMTEYQYTSRKHKIGETIDIREATITPFLGEHYLFFQVSYLPIDIMYLSFGALWNVLDNGYLFSLTYNWNIMQSCNMIVYGRFLNEKLNVAGYDSVADIPVGEYAIRFEVYF